MYLFRHRGSQLIQLIWNVCSFSSSRYATMATVIPLVQETHFPKLFQNQFRHERRRLQAKKHIGDWRCWIYVRDICMIDCSCISKLSHQILLISFLQTALHTSSSSSWKSTLNSRSSTLIVLTVSPLIMYLHIQKCDVNVQMPDCQTPQYRTCKRSNIFWFAFTFTKPLIATSRLLMRGEP